MSNYRNIINKLKIEIMSLQYFYRNNKQFLLMELSKKIQKQKQQLIQRTESTKLLSILAKREKQTTFNVVNGWPGLRKPSFSNVSKLITHQKRISNTQNRKQSTFMSSGVKSIPIISKSSKFLSLYPLREPNLSETVKDLMLENSSNTDFFKNQHIRLKSRQALRNKQKEANLIQKKLISVKIQNSQIKNKTQASDQQAIKKKKLKDYIIDFEAFNYINKIIDSSDSKLWSKYIHKKHFAQN